jgi:hypothetical protein
LNAACIKDTRRSGKTSINLNQSNFTLNSRYIRFGSYLEKFAGRIVEYGWYFVLRWEHLLAQNRCYRRVLGIAFVSLFSLLSGACNFPVARDEDLPISASAIPSTEITTVQPTQPVPPGKVILLAPPGANEALMHDMESAIADLTENRDLVWEGVSVLSEDELESTVRLVVALAPDQGMAELASSTPHVHFLAVGIAGLAPSANLSVIGPEGDRPDQIGFMAGFLAAVATPDWRVGVISEDTPAGRAARLGFINGVRYFCGQCRQVYPPFLQYPMEASLVSVDESWQSVVDELLQGSVQTVYVFPQNSSDSMLAYLTEHGVTLIGSEDRKEGVGSERWVMIHSDPAIALRAMWDDLLAGEGGKSMPMPLSIEVFNSELFTPGRQRLAEETLQDLIDGYIDTAVNPLTGESR